MYTTLLKVVCRIEEITEIAKVATLASMKSSRTIAQDLFYHGNSAIEQQEHFVENVSQINP